MNWSTGKYFGIAQPPGWVFKSELKYDLQWEMRRFNALVWHSLNFSRLK